MHGRPRIPLVAALATAALPLAVSATTVDYTLELPPNQAVAYLLQLEPRHAGRLVVEADWTAERVLVLRLEPPDAAAVRRTGLSPQRIEVELDPAALAEGRAWQLAIRGLPSRHAGRGTVRVTLPDAVTPADRAARPAVPAPVVAGGRATIEPRAAPGGASPEDARLFAAIERLRLAVVAPDAPAPDICRWQAELLRYLAASRDRGARPAPPTSRLLERMARTVLAVEELRASTDPLLGPSPAAADGLQRRAWEVLFRERTAPLRGALDGLLADLDPPPAELTGEAWPVRLASCLAACERHFEELRLRGAEQASNRELAEHQWSRMLAAADALSSLAARGAETAAPVK